jgi:hypothetical protein
MRRVTSRRSIHRAIRWAVSVVLAFTFVQGTVFAQRLGGRPGGAPRVSGPRPFPPVFSHRAFYRVQPIFPIFVPSRFGFWGPLYGFRLGLRFNAIWPNCGPYWGFAPIYNCYVLPMYISDGGGRELAQLYLKDGTVYNVTDYWLVDNQLHFTTIDDSGTQWVEHTVPFDQLDLQKTTDVSKQRGFRFVLRNEPLQEYLRDHPEIGAPGAAPPASAQPQHSQPQQP